MGKAGSGLDRQARPGVAGRGKARRGRQGTAAIAARKAGMNQERIELERLLEVGGGVLKVESVVSTARDPENVLHKHFEWDDSVAAEEHRKQQARILIQRCNITIQAKEETTIRAFVSLPADRDAGGGYRLMREVLASPDMRAQLQAEIDAQVRMWRDKARLLSPEYVNWLLDAPRPEERKAA